jgi:lipopolysaccharide export system protein LptA
LGLLVLLTLVPAARSMPASDAPWPGSPASTPAAPVSADAAGTRVPAGPARLNTGLVTIESDLQRADQSTGVVTATGNVRIVYPDQRVLATARQAQFFSREGRVVLSGDVEIVQEGGNLLRAERVVYLVDSERMVAVPPDGHQVLSRFRIPAAPTPAAGAAQPSGERP